MKSLIIPDIHNRVSAADQLISLAGPVDEIICLGDFWDDFYDTTIDARRTAVWVKGLKAVKLLGNHDLPYLFGEEHACPGYTLAKHRVIREVLTAAERWEFDLWARRGSWLLTHGGLNSRMKNAWNPDAKLEHFSFAQSEATKEQLAKGDHCPIVTNVSMMRGGLNAHAGILWCDWRELDVLPGINQIVGHTPVPRFQFAQAGGNINVLLDTNTRNYGILHDGDELEVFSATGNLEGRFRPGPGQATVFTP